MRQARQGKPTVHQAHCSAPLKVMRSRTEVGGRCTLPLLHTGGGMVGGDELTIDVELAEGSSALITSAAAQRVYGSIGLRVGSAKGRWARQHLCCRLEARSDLEWLPQELVLYRNGLYEQRIQVELAEGASFLAGDVVRLGRTAAGEALGAGRWRSAIDLARHHGDADAQWELVERLELDGPSMASSHGLDGHSVAGSLIWAAPASLDIQHMRTLLEECRQDRAGLDGEMACGALPQGLVARYRGPSTQCARYWFTRLWQRIRCARGLPAPELPREWPFQEEASLSMARPQLQAGGSRQGH